MFKRFIFCRRLILFVIDYSSEFRVNLIILLDKHFQVTSKQQLD